MAPKPRTTYLESISISNPKKRVSSQVSCVLERLRGRFVVGTRLHFHELVEFQRGRCGDDMKCVRPDQEMRALYRFLRRHPCIGLVLDPVRGGRPRAQPVVFVVARTECE